ncbi:p24 complex component [Dinochytrium kinnereticum]|nr:p24 complex component [Dinochytrium kinnereticum]
MRLVVLIVTALALLGCASASIVFQIRLAPHMKQCFFEVLSPGDRMDITYQVYDGGNLQVDFWITAPDERMVQSSFKQTTGTYGFNAEQNGQYIYCFSNQVGVYDKAITFSMKGPDEKVRFEEKYNDSKEDFHTPVNEEIAKLAESIRTLVDETNYLNAREMAHRSTARSTNTRVFWWSVFQALGLVVVCILQVYYIRSFFEVKSRSRV